MALKRFGVSLEENLVEALDKYASESGFANRSQAIRFLVEKNIAENKWHCDHVVAGSVLIMYDQSRRQIEQKMAEIHHEYQDVILSSSQYFINEVSCLQVTVIKGVAHRLTEFSDRLAAIKGIKHAKLLMSRAD